MKRLATVKKILQQKGFSHIKIELEANFDEDAYERHESECARCEGSGNEPCDYCGGSGRINCNACDGSGEWEVVTNGGGQLKMIDCPNCEGNGHFDCEDCDEGYVECGRCEGSGTEYDDYDSDGYPQEIENDFFDQLPGHIREIITYSRFYNDGSVNTELTLTIPVEYAEYLETIIETFRDCPGYRDVENAGMHITLLNSDYYPTGKRLPDKEIRNFKKAMERLLPLLYLLGSYGDGATRGLNFRRPGIESGDKYNAIFTNNNTSIEYRLFDPCYDNPKRIFHFLRLIAGTMFFYSKKSRKVGRCGTLDYKSSSYIYLDELVKITDGKEKTEMIKTIQAMLGYHRTLTAAFSRETNETFIKALGRATVA